MNVAQVTRTLAVIFLAGCAGCAPNADPAPSPNPAPDVAPEPVSVAEPGTTTDESPGGITITVDVTKLRSSDGMVQVTLYDKADEFLMEDSKTARIVRVGIEDKKSTCEFAGVEPGKYAVALMHDEDNDGEMKKSLIGLPKEGIGMSNNGKLKFGPPKWEDSVFDVGEEDVSIEITLLYM